MLSHTTLYPSLSNPIFISKCIKRNHRFTILSSGVSKIEKQAIDTTGEDDKKLYVKAGKRVVLVRHGESTWNKEGRIQGSSNYSVLTCKGESQAEASRHMLSGDSFDICFASPLNRSKRTAEIIWDSRQQEIVTDYDLREIDLYSFQGLLKHEGIEKFGSAFQKWQTDSPNFIIDGHYPVRELWDRARSCWSKILGHENSSSVLVVAHNAINQALVATALGLGTEYFRVLVQSNCGVSVLDFTPGGEGESPYVCLNRLNQTPKSPFSSGTSGGRKASSRIVLVCHGSSQSNSEDINPSTGDRPMNMLGIIQSQKIAELLLDLKLNSSPKAPSIDTGNAISRVQEAADCLGADSLPRHVELKQMADLDIEKILQKSENKDGSFDSNRLSLFKDDVITSALWDQSERAWKSLLKKLSSVTDTQNIIAAVAHPAVHIAMMCHCLNLTKERLGSFHLDAGSISVVDFPDGPTGRGVLRSINYTAHLGRWSIPITRPKHGINSF